MAKVAKITIFVEQSMNQETIRVRTTGLIGTTQLNTISTDVQYPSRSPSPDAPTFFAAVLNRALTQL